MPAASRSYRSRQLVLWRSSRSPLSAAPERWCRSNAAGLPPAARPWRLKRARPHSGSGARRSAPARPATAPPAPRAPTLSKARPKRFADAAMRARWRSSRTKPRRISGSRSVPAGGAPAKNRALSRHSAYSASAFESCTTPPPMPSVPLLPDIVSVRIATLKRAPPSGAKYPIAPQ